jgi:hypothetical protein
MTKSKIRNIALKEGVCLQLYIKGKDSILVENRDGEIYIGTMEYNGRRNMRLWQ